MQRFHILIIVLAALVLGVLSTGCTPEGPCLFTSNTELTLYRVSDASTDFWGVELKCGCFLGQGGAT